MKISRDWLNEYVDSGSRPDEEIATRLTAIGHAVEAVELHGDDRVFEIEFTSNRIDAMSHRGVARDLAAALGTELRSIAVEPLPAARSEVSVEIAAPELCSRFTGVVIHGVSIGPSSPLLQRRLEAVGLRPINNVVDVTNYVMLALGHPLHAYDLSTIAGKKIVVRAGGAGERFTTLDGIERILDATTCVIADGERAIGLGGVMGGANSEITAQTRDVFLECAHFDAASIRRTGRRLGMKSDAAYRFERGVDPNDTIETVMTAAQLIVELAGGTLGGSVDVVARPTEPKSIQLRESRLHEASAHSVGLDYALDLFRRLGMDVKQVADHLDVIVPTYRVDIFEEQDLVEEVLRFFGFNNIPVSLPRLSTGDVRHEPLADLEEEMRDLLAAFGLSEVITYSFVHPSHNELFTADEAVTLDNALNENLSVMRLSILPGLLQSVAHNRSYGTRDGALFEVGRTYHRHAVDVVEERRCAAFVLFGQPPAAWGESRRAWDYFDAKGVVEAIGRKLKLELTVEPATRQGYRAGQTAQLLAGGRAVATIGALEPAVLQKFDLKGDVMAGELDLAALSALLRPWKLRPVSKFPGVPMVLGMFHPATLTYQAIVERIEQMKIEQLREVGLWDRFTPKDAAAGEVKTAIGLWYQATDRSLTQEEVAEMHRNLTERLAAELPVRIITT